MIPAAVSWHRGPVLYLHGGGMVAGSVPTFDGPVSRYAARTGVPMLSVRVPAGIRASASGTRRSGRVALRAKPTASACCAACDPATYPREHLAILVNAIAHPRRQTQQANMSRPARWMRHSRVSHRSASTARSLQPIVAR